MKTRDTEEDIFINNPPIKPLNPTIHQASTHGKVSNVITRWGSADQSHRELHSTPVRVAETKNIPSSARWKI